MNKHYKRQEVQKAEGRVEKHRRLSRFISEYSSFYCGVYVDGKRNAASLIIIITIITKQIDRAPRKILPAKQLNVD